MPYAPGTRDRSGEFIGAGLQQLGQGLANWRERSKQRKEQLKQDAEFMQGVASVFEQVMPDSDIDFSQYSPAQLRGALQGMLVGNQMQHQQFNQRMNAERLESAQRANDMGEAQQAQEAQMLDMVSNIASTYETYQENPNAPVSAEMLSIFEDPTKVRALEAHDRGLLSAMETLQALYAEPEAENAVQVLRDPETGERLGHAHNGQVRWDERPEEPPNPNGPMISPNGDWYYTGDEWRPLPLDPTIAVQMQEIARTLPLLREPEELRRLERRIEALRVQNQRLRGGAETPQEQSFWEALRVQASEAAAEPGTRSSPVDYDFSNIGTLSGGG